MQTTITPQDITQAQAIGRVTVESPDWIHITLDVDRGAQITGGWGEFAVYVTDKWTTQTTVRTVATFAEALAAINRGLESS